MNEEIPRPPNPVLDAFIIFHSCVLKLELSILEGEAQNKKEMKKRPSKRRTKLIEGYAETLETAKLVHKHGLTELPFNFDKLTKPIQEVSLFPLLVGRGGVDERVLSVILDRGEAYWLKKKQSVNNFIRILLYHPFGKFGRRGDNSEEMGRKGGKLSSRYKSAIKAMANELKKRKSKVRLTQKRIWDLTKEYTSSEPFEFEDCEVYRDGDKLFHVDNSGKYSEIGYHSFRKTYLSNKKVEK